MKSTIGIINLKLAYMRFQLLLSHWFLLLGAELCMLIGAGCRQGGTTDGSASAYSQLPARTQVIAGTPMIRPMQEHLLMNAVTTYINQENIRATSTGFIERSQVVLGKRVQHGQVVFQLKTKEASVLGEEILNDPDIKITGIIPIHAKNSGIITQLFFQEGDYVVDGDVLATLARPQSLNVKLYVPYEYNRYIRAQKQISVHLPDGETLRGRVGQLLPSEEVISQTTPYLVSLRPFRFLPENLNVTASVVMRDNPQAVVVPTGALQSNEEQSRFWIMKIVADTLAIRYAVTPGIRTDSLVELINPGLAPTDRIIVKGAYGLPDTAAISIVEKL